MAQQLTGRQKSEAKRQIVISNPSVCYFCKSTGLTEADKFCPNCGFPQRGGQVAMKKFIWNVKNKHVLLVDQKKAISKARDTLFGIGALFLLFAVLSLTTVENGLIMFIASLIVAGGYVGLGFWSIKNPFPAILTGFFVFVTLLVLQGVIDPGSIFKGALGKGFIIAGLFYGYKGVKDSTVLEKELESIKKVKDLKTPDELSEMPS